MTSSSPARTVADDPGVLRSLRSGTPLGQIRMVGAVFCLIPPVIGALVPALLDKGDAGPSASTGGIIVAVSLLLALIGTALAVPRQFAPVPVDAEPAGVLPDAVARVRATMFLGLSLGEIPVLVGFVLAVSSGHALPYVIGFVGGWPLMLAAIPTGRRIERARSRLESAGARVPIWDGLL